MVTIHNLLLAGCGNMGGALLGGWRTRNAAANIYVVDPAQKDAHKTLADVPAHFAPDVVVFAVKPQQMDALLPEYAARFGTKPLYISIAAGKPLAYFAKHLGPQARIVRAMPNTPALVGAGITALLAGPHATPADRDMAEALFSAVGAALWLDREDEMHAVTALSGSGPAYTFLFLEALTTAATAAGLPEPAAIALALHTVAGSCELAGQTGTGFAALRTQVTSPGGTTEAGLKALTALPEIVKNAVNQAIERSKELG